MADYAHTETDKRIEELEKRLQAEYRQAYKETKGKLEKYLSDFARKDEAKRKLVDEGKLSQADYKKWRTNQMLTGQRWVKMVDTLAKDMNRTNQIAADTEAFAAVAEWGLYQVQLTRIVAKCFKENGASYKMLSSCMRKNGEDDTFFYFEKLV